MKTCPICDTTLFDDMEVCYGCMYSFGSKPDLERKAQQPADETVAIAASAPSADGEKEAERVEAICRPPQSGERDATVSLGEPLPLALLTQAATTMPGWGIRFEMHDETAPHQVWSMELTPPRAASNA